MTYIRPFLPADVLAIDLQPMQALGPVTIDLAYGEMAAAGEAWTAFTHDGTVVGCGGILPVYPKQGLAWALFAARVGHGMTIITRQARDAIIASPFRRVEAVVRADWPPARRWAEAVGLTLRCELPCWGPAGTDHLYYDRIAA